MRLPALLGPNPVGYSEDMVRRFAMLVRQLAGDGYAQGDDSLRFLELLAQAIAPAVGDNTLKRSFNQSFKLLVTETLREWEREIGLPNDNARSDERRRLRVALAERLGGHADFARWIDEGLADFGVTEIVSPDAATVASEACEEETAFNVTVVAPDVSNAARNSIIDAVRRAIPAKSYGHHSVGSVRAMVVDEVGAQWDSPTQKMGRTALRVEEQDPALTTTHEPSRIVSYGPGTTIRAADLTAIQRALMWHPSESSDAISLPGSGGIAKVVQVVLPPLTSKVIDNADSWKDRFVTGCYRHTTQNIHAGEVSDDLFNTEPFGQIAIATFDGGADSEQTINGDTILGVDATTGYLELFNTHATNTYYVVMMLWATSTFGVEGSVIERSKNFVDGARFITDAIDEDNYPVDWFEPTWVTGCRDSAALTRCTPEGPALMDQGGVHRMAFIPTTDNGGGTVDDVRVLDTRLDWRDRYLTLVAVFVDETVTQQGAWPGSFADAELRSTASPDAGVHSLWYTGLGGVDYELTLPNSLALSVDDTTGALSLEHQSGSTVDLASWAIIVIATEQLGERSSPDTATGVNPLNGFPITPRDLNTIQDVGVMSVPRRDSLTRDVLPIGRIADGYDTGEPDIFNPPVDGPRICYDAELRGVRVDSRIREQMVRARPSFVGYPSLMNPAGGLLLHFAIEVPADSNMMLDDTADWRDRFITGIGRYIVDGASSDIWPGGANEDNHNSPGVLWSQGFYSGDRGRGYDGGGEPPGTPTFHYAWFDSTFIYADPTTGNLMIGTHTTGKTVTGMIRATPRLGPRSNTWDRLPSDENDDGFNSGFGPP